MSEYVIITDTSADIPASVLDKGQIHLIPMVYQLNGEEHPHKTREAGTAKPSMTSFVMEVPEAPPRSPRLYTPIILSPF